jgi:DNA-binding GntR family transcriptional regulator
LKQETETGTAGSNPTLKASVATELRAEILNGSIKPGSPLREVPLSERYGTSRQSVREALRLLADQGLVHLASRRGAVVPKLGPSEVRETYTMRAQIESYALHTAMIEGRIGKPERDAIDEAYQHIAAVAGSEDPARLIEADMAFHRALCSPCDHRMLLECLDRLQTATRLTMMHMKVYRSEAENDVESHAPILHALYSNDASGASSALSIHITQNGERLLLKMLEDQQGKSTPGTH